MTYLITIDKRLCSGFGSCVQSAPGAFALRGGTALALVTTSADPAVLDAAERCPMGAITVELEQAA